MAKSSHECSACGGRGRERQECPDCKGSGSILEDVVKMESCSNPLCNWGWEAVRCNCLHQGGPLKGCKSCEGTGFVIRRDANYECPPETHVRGKHHLVHPCGRCRGTGVRKFLLRLPKTCATCTGAGVIGKTKVCIHCSGTGRKPIGFIPARLLDMAYSSLRA